MRDTVDSILGGINKIPSNVSTLRVSGGFMINSKHIEHNILIGNLIKTFIKNKFLEWDSFKDTYYVNKKLPIKDYNNFLCVLNDIFPLPVYTVDENELLFLIKNIYMAKPNELMAGFTKMTPIYKPLNSAIRHLFMAYKIYLEKIIEIFVQLRQDHISTNKLKGNPNDFSKLLDRWNAIDIENKVNTSSLILFFNFPPTSMKLEDTVPSINWYDGASKNTPFNKSISKFLTKATQLKFNYLGFCPHAAIHRFKLLLQFPVKELLDAIKVLDLSRKYSDINSKCNKLTTKIVALQKKSSNLKSNIVSTIKLDNRVISKKIDLDKFSKSMSVGAKIDIFEIYIDKFLKLYKNITPYLIKKEFVINKLSTGINIVARELQTLVDSYITEK